MSFQTGRFIAVATLTVLTLPVLAKPATKSSTPAGPSQASLAHSGAFASVSASSAKAAIPATDLSKAKTKLNQMASFTGVVTDVYAPKNGKRVLLDFAANYKTAVIGLVEAKNFKTFPDLKQLKNKRVMVMGKVIDYKGQTQVELTSASAIKLVK